MCVPWVRSWASDILTATGAMGKRSNPNAVTDPTGKVYGVQGLRVVDASAFPLLPPGHPQATVCKLLHEIRKERRRLGC